MLPLRTIRKTKKKLQKRNDLKDQRDNESTKTRGSTLQKDEKQFPLGHFSSQGICQFLETCIRLTEQRVAEKSSEF